MSSEINRVDPITRRLRQARRVVRRAWKCPSSRSPQQFNTTSSMGRLTLNVLLSFAQFERAVTSERIRDKIAASKRRGFGRAGQVRQMPPRYPRPSRRLGSHAVARDRAPPAARLLSASCPCEVFWFTSRPTTSGFGTRSRSSPSRFAPSNAVKR